MQGSRVVGAPESAGAVRARGARRSPASLLLVAAFLLLVCCPTARCKAADVAAEEAGEAEAPEEVREAAGSEEASKGAPASSSSSSSARHASSPSSTTASSPPPALYWMDLAAFAEGETDLLREAIEKTRGRAALAGVSAGGFLAPKGYYDVSKFDIYWTGMEQCLRGLARPLERRHFFSCVPGTGVITGKRLLVESLERAFGPSGAASIAPRSFAIPGEYLSFARAVSAAGPDRPWVVKEDVHRGKGVHVLAAVDALRAAARGSGREGDAPELPVARAVRWLAKHALRAASFGLYPPPERRTTPVFFGKGGFVEPARDVLGGAKKGSRGADDGASSQASPSASPPTPPLSSAPKAVVAQRFLNRQMLVDRRPFYVRLWAVVVGAQPLRAHLFEGGVVVFGSKQSSRRPSGAAVVGDADVDAGEGVRRNLGREARGMDLLEADAKRAEEGRAGASAASAGAGSPLGAGVDAAGRGREGGADLSRGEQVGRKDAGDRDASPSSSLRDTLEKLGYVDLGGADRKDARPPPPSSRTPHDALSAESASDMVVNLWKQDREAADPWPLERLWQHLEETKGKGAAARTAAAVRARVAAAVAAAVPSVRATSVGFPGFATSQGGFAVLGVDFLFDEDARPWLVEVNWLPSLARKVVGGKGGSDGQGGRKVAEAGGEGAEGAGDGAIGEPGTSAGASAASPSPSPAPSSSIAPRRRSVLEWDEPGPPPGMVIRGRVLKEEAERGGKGAEPARDLERSGNGAEPARDLERSGNGAEPARDLERSGNAAEPARDLERPGNGAGAPSPAAPSPLPPSPELHPASSIDLMASSSDGSSRKASRGARGDFSASRAGGRDDSTNPEGDGEEEEEEEDLDETPDLFTLPGADEELLKEAEKGGLVDIVAEGGSAAVAGKRAAEGGVVEDGADSTPTESSSSSASARSSSSSSALPLGIAAFDVEKERFLDALVSLTIARRQAAAALDAEEELEASRPRLAASRCLPRELETQLVFARAESSASPYLTDLTPLVSRALGCMAEPTARGKACGALLGRAPDDAEAAENERRWLRGEPDGSADDDDQATTGGRGNGKGNGKGSKSSKTASSNGQNPSAAPPSSRWRTIASLARPWAPPRVPNWGGIYRLARQRDWQRRWVERETAKAQRKRRGKAADAAAPADPSPTPPPYPLTPLDRLVRSLERLVATLASYTPPMRYAGYLAAPPRHREALRESTERLKGEEAFRISRAARTQYKVSPADAAVDAWLRSGGNRAPGAPGETHVNTQVCLAYRAAAGRQKL